MKDTAETIELKSALDRLKISEERYRIAAETSSEIIFDYNVQDNSIYHSTTRVEALYGIPQFIENGPDFLVAHGVILPDSASDFLRIFQKMRDGEARAECVIRTRNAAGGFFWNSIILTVILDEQQKPVKAVGILRDITSQKEAELQYQSELLFHNAISRDSFLFYEADLTNQRIITGHYGEVEFSAMPNMDDYSSVVQTLCDNFIYQKDRVAFFAALSLENILAQYATGKTKVEFECRRVLEGGIPSWISCIAHLLKEEKTGYIKAFFYIQDIDDMKKKELELKEKAEHDLLTGLYNKGTTEMLIRSYLSKADNSENGLAAFMIVDLDDFKAVNDQLGHAFGDAVLSETAHHLSSICGKSDIAGRIGGDEFVLFFKALPDACAAQSKADKLCEMFQNAYAGVLKDYKVSGSVGIAQVPEEGISFDELYRRADLALYTAKKRGKNNWCLFSDDINESTAHATVPAMIDRSTGKTFSENIIEYVFRILYESRDLRLATSAILELVAKHFGYCRGYLYEVCEDGCCRNTFEWRASGALPLSNELKTISKDMLARYEAYFGEDGLHVVDSVNQLDPPMRNLLSALNIKSQLQYKLVNNGKFQGFIGFDRDGLEQAHVADEPSVLQVIAQTLDVFLSEKKVNEQLAESNKILQILSDNLDTYSYIVDPDTFVLRFTNAKTRQIIPAALPGTFCYQSIRQFDAPCADCPILHMKNNNTKDYQTEIYNVSLNLWTKVDASFVELAHDVECCLLNCYDITEYKNRDGEYIVDAHAFTSDFTLYDALCRSTDDYIYMCDMPKNLFYFPQNMVEEFNLPSQLIENAALLWGSLIHEHERQEFFDAFQDIVDGRANIYYQDCRALNRDGNWIWLRCRGYLEHNAAGSPTLFAGIITNLAKKSKVDHVSGLPNKYMFENHVRSQLADESEGWLLLMGLDNFKHINNLYGLEFGDQVIRITAEQLQALLPDQVQVFRLDGDVFGVLIPQKEPSELESIYSIVQVAFHHQQELDGHRYTCTISAGCTKLAGTAAEFDMFFKQAEYALEYAKCEGKNRLSFYNAEAMSGRERSLALIELLRESIEQNYKNFELYFQPQVDADTHEVISAEALLRWKCAEYGVVSPVEFIPLLEQTGMIRPVGHWILSQAIEVCLEWRKIKPDFTVSVNLSYLQLLEKNFISLLTSAMHDKGLDASALHLELTESRIADGSRSLSQSFDELRGLGFCIEMDDFGTGYSSLEILKNKPADVVKIDRAFVKDINRSDFDATFIRFVVSLCHSVGIRVCLEGVENWDEYTLVKPMGLDTIQGYLFGKPESKSNFELHHFGATQT